MFQLDALKKLLIYNSKNKRRNMTVCRLVTGIVASTQR
jgi:hypothetical protein